MDPNASESAPDRAERHSRLLGVKLVALVGDHLGLDPDVRSGLEAEPIPSGAAVVVDGAAWVLVEGAAHRSLGGALAWAVRRDATSLSLIADSDTGLLARRATRFRYPVDVWFPQGRTLLPAVAEPLPVPVAPEPEHLALLDVIAEAGATPAIEHGVVFGEVCGLEVCRVVDQPTVGLFAELGDVGPMDLGPAGAAPADAGATGPVDRPAGVQLEVGVGANDREAFALLHGDIPTVEALATVVESVAAVRSPDAPQHPLNRLAQERALRWRLQQDPSLVRAVRLEPAEPPVPRRNLTEVVPCVARAVVADGSEIAVVCSVGIDVDLVPFVADVQAAGAGPVTVAVPRRDLVGITDDLASLLHEPVELVAVD